MYYLSEIEEVRRSKTKIGLDIGSYAVKMIEVSPVKNGYHLLGFGVKELTDTTKDGITNAIVTLCDELKPSSDVVNISVSGPQVVVRFLTLPYMSGSDIKNALEFELEKYIPFDISEVVTDYKILSKDKKARHIDILLALVKRTFVEQRIGIAEKAGLSVSVVDVDSFALVNAFFENYPNLDMTKTVALLNIGASSTNVSILKENSLRFSRDARIGGRAFDECISKALGLNMKEAEKLKLKSQESEEAVSSCITTVLGNLMDETRLSFGYFENQYGKGVDDIYISGGTSKLKGLAEYIQENFGFKSIAWNPLGFLDIRKKEIDRTRLNDLKGILAVCTGLVLR